MMAEGEEEVWITVLRPCPHGIPPTDKNCHEPFVMRIVPDRIGTDFPEDPGCETKASDTFVQHDTQMHLQHPESPDEARMRKPFSYVESISLPSTKKNF